jgi:hypothetical protein
MPLSEIMKNTKCQVNSERGAALVIAIFSLMLISVVATSLILTADTQNAIKSNYRSAMQAFYDAKAGLEEARGLVQWPVPPNPNAITNCVFPGGAGAAISPGQACYIINPAAGENVDPRNTANTNPYADLEFQQEWGTAPPAGAQLIPSASPNSGIAGPLYKWVRITAKTEASVSPNFDSDADGRVDTTPLFLSGQNVIDSKNGIPPGAAQVLTITSLAVTPSGSRRMVQYSVAPSALGPAFANFPSALTLDGNGVIFQGPAPSESTENFKINGNDSNPPSAAAPGVPAIGYTNSNDATSISASAVPAANYLSPTGVPNVGLVTLPPILQTPSGLDSLVRNIAQSADVVLPTPGASGTPDQQSLPPACTAPPSPSPCMSASNPVVVVVNGDFNLHGYGTGYGLLVVTGKLDYDPDASWNGFILVIGKGIFTSTRAGLGAINGGVFVAQTRDAAGNLLPDPNLGHASFTQTGGGNGIRYSSSWVKAAEALMPYQVLSFREIAQTTP